MGKGKFVWTGTDTYIKFTTLWLFRIYPDRSIHLRGIPKVQLDVNMSGLRQTPLTCSGHTRPVVQLAFSDVTPFGYFLISACKGRFGEISGRLFQFLKQYGRQFSNFLKRDFLLLVLRFFVSYYSTCFHYIFKTRAYIFCSEYDFYTDG